MKTLVGDEGLKRPGAIAEGSRRFETSGRWLVVMVIIYFTRGRWIFRDPLSKVIG